MVPACGVGLEPDLLVLALATDHGDVSVALDREGRDGFGGGM